jgi:uncharacterized protein RhaS with RHS repeats
MEVRKAIEAAGDDAGPAREQQVEFAGGAVHVRQRGQDDLDALPGRVDQSGSFTFLPGETLYMMYDAMGRSQKLGTTPGGGELVSTTAYDVDGTLASMASGGGTETRTYNTLGQLTGINAPGISIVCAFPGSGNNERIGSMTFNADTVAYTYDSLNRLVQASSNQGWAESYTDDRYGNLTNKAGQSLDNAKGVAKALYGDGIHLQHCDRGKVIPVP